MNERGIAKIKIHFTERFKKRGRLAQLLDLMHIECLIKICGIEWNGIKYPLKTLHTECLTS